MPLEGQIIDALCADIPQGQTPRSYARLAFLEWALQHRDLTQMMYDARRLSERLCQIAAPAPALHAFRDHLFEVVFPLAPPVRRGGRSARLAARHAA